jgi:hypothetical protein
MTFNFRLMKRYNPDNPTMYWYEIVEVFYGQDKVPAFWGEAYMPAVDQGLIDEVRADDEDFDEASFVRTELANEWALIAKDIVRDSEVFDEFDFEPGGKYYGHDEAKDMNEITAAVKSGDPEVLAELGITTVDSKDFIKKLMKEDDEENGKEKE